MNKRQFNWSKNNDTYCTSTNQYLISRNRSFQQNQYNYIRQGDASLKPGSSKATTNIYSPNGINHCRKYKISSVFGNNYFQYRWIDYSSTSTTYTVTIPDGYYDLDEVVSIFKAAMVSNNHYFYNKSNYAKIFLLNILVNIFYL